ncbi:hypothetical protein EIK77_003502 [Talaromyces pinophilus]|nr:hypothetical protein EIK77_003502 [Talaromyces pinophilus]
MPKDGCKELIGCIIRFYEKDTQDKPLPRLKLLVTGRPYSHIAKLQKLSSDRYFCFDNNSPTQALRDDINLVIQSRTEELTHFDDGERQEIVRLFEEKENCTYLWFTLMFNIIESTPSAYSRLSDIRELLAQIPLEIDDAYEHILEKAQDRRVAMKLFQIVIASPPLHIKVLNVALTLAIGSEKIKTYEDIYKNLYKSDFYDNILRNLSELFLVIREDYVYFIHRTARDFMLINNSADCRSNRQWKGSLNEEDAHGLM